MQRVASAMHMALPLAAALLWVGELSPAIAVVLFAAMRRRSGACAVLCWVLAGVQVAVLLYRACIMHWVSDAALWAGYSGRVACGGIFISNRTLSSIRRHDLFWLREGKHSASGRRILFERIYVHVGSVSVWACDTLLTCRRSEWEYEGRWFGCRLASGGTFLRGVSPILTGEITAGRAAVPLSMGEIAGETAVEIEQPGAARTSPWPAAAQQLPADVSGPVGLASRAEIQRRLASAFADVNTSGVHDAPRPAECLGCRPFAPLPS